MSRTNLMQFSKCNFSPFERLKFQTFLGEHAPIPPKSLNNLNFLNFLNMYTEEFLSAKSLIDIVAGKVLHSVVVNYLLISWTKSIKTSHFYWISEFSFCIYGGGGAYKDLAPSVKSTPPRHSLQLCDFDPRGGWRKKIVEQGKVQKHTSKNGLPRILQLKIQKRKKLERPY